MRNIDVFAAAEFRGISIFHFAYIVQVGRHSRSIIIEAPECLSLNIVIVFRSLKSGEQMFMRIRQRSGRRCSGSLMPGISSQDAVIFSSLASRLSAPATEYFGGWSPDDNIS